MRRRSSSEQYAKDLAMLIEVRDKLIVEMHRLGIDVPKSSTPVVQACRLHDVKPWTACTQCSALRKAVK